MFHPFRWLLHRTRVRFDGQEWYDSLKLVDTIVVGTLKAHILEDPKPCGHVRYFVDLVETRGPHPLYIGMLEEGHISSSVELLQSADSFIRNYHEHG